MFENWINIFKSKINHIIILILVCSNYVLAQSDMSPPTLTKFTISDICINTSSDIMDVTFSTELSDNLSGVADVFLGYLTPNGLSSSFEMQLVSGDSLNGSYELVVTYDNSDVAGVYTYGIYATDNFNNSLSVSMFGRELLQAGFTDSLKIINSNSDSIVPSLIDFEISETCIDVLNGSIDVVFTATLTDSLSGVADVFLGYLTPNGLSSSFEMQLVSGDSLNGSYELIVPYDNSDVAGVYTYGIYATDNFNNSLSVSMFGRELLQAGFTDSVHSISPNFEVFSGTIRFTSSNRGLIYENDSGDCFRVTVDSNGNIESKITECPLLNAAVTVEKSHVYIGTNNAPVVMTSQNGVSWKLEIDNLGNLMTLPYNNTGIDQTFVEDGDLYLDKSINCSTNGVIIKSSDGSCWLLNLDLNSQLHGLSINCP